MHKYELTYEHMNAPKTIHGEAPERVDAHELLMNVKLGGKASQIVGTDSLEESLERMRLTNVCVTWL
ncbi:hypothetical protein [Pseudomonas sp. ICMP 460]|uniref:hypothetical protein n=1 Tax=Pseudomonas sp. ICMP 460 TaxID=1718917 RepID=UPI000C07EA13|nr:hypothetical protein [Pseudomonas sp. ICMP 460]PHN29431.1 hypothetical protein AO240_20615 [Pseudomonas sp. ICMP 460]